MRWDPAQYARFADERSRPFFDLAARIEAAAPRRVVDLGCGPGLLTAALARRWPQAQVDGIDSSPEMIAQAGAVAGARLSFRVEDVANWAMPADCDVIISNATLQWVPRHRELLSSWARRLPAGGWIAIQLPGNFSSPSHRLMRELAESPRYDVGDALGHHDSVGTPAEYATLLLDADLGSDRDGDLEVDAWETTYLHRLPGSDPVLEWVRGTGLRPVLAALSAADCNRFEQEYAAALRLAYPQAAHGTLFTFRRVFAVAHRSSA